MSELVDDTVKVYSDVWNVIRNRGDLSNKEVNTFVLTTLLDNDLITIDSARELVESNYIVIEDNSILDKYEEGESFFEEIGGCLLIGGCEGDNGFIKEISRINVYNANETGVGEDISFQVISVTSNRCIQEGNCNSDEEIVVNLKVNTGYGERDMTVVTDGKYRWIPDTMKYVFAEIDNGKLFVGVAKYSIGG